MLRICIPVHNEATTIGVLLWRLRSVFQGFSREYDVVVYDDASTDGTGDVLEPYQSVMPLTVIRGAAHRGYAGSIDALVRHVAADDEYARRDAMVLLQGDFTESPEHLPELVKRFEGGADLVAVHRTTSDATPLDERRLRRWGRWAVKPFLRLPPVADPFTGFRLVRISVLRELLKALGSRPVCAGEGWAANIDFALNVAPFARRIENVEFAPRYDVRQRASRRRGWPDVVALFHWARAARGTARPIPGSKPSADQPSRAAGESALVSLPAERGTRSAPAERAARGGRRDQAGRPPRDGTEGGAAAAREARPQREERPPRDERETKEARGAREERALRGEERQPAPDRASRERRPPRPERAAIDERAATAEAAEITSSAQTGATGDLLSAPEDVTEPKAVEEGAASEKRAKRRRRRSRRDRGALAADGSALGTAPSEDGSVGADAFEGNAGTSEDAAGEQESGDDRSVVAESGTMGAETDGEGVRRKRRSRRRRRGRRPGGPEAAASEPVPPPGAEPPAS